MSHNLEYIVFGSENSIDKDILVIVHELPFTIEDCKILIDGFSEILQKDFKEKVNINIGTIDDGIITSVMKGTSDEVNNSIYHTQTLHSENSKLYITKLVNRDVDRKILRAFRIMLSMLSRTNHRELVKDALRNDITQKLFVLETLNLNTITELGKSNMTWPDYLKTMAFQIGQTLALINGVEVYSKNDICFYYPQLTPYINRVEDADLYALDFTKRKLCDLVKKREMKIVNEY